jgi:hypothetical protein
MARVVREPGYADRAEGRRARRAGGARAWSNRRSRSCRPADPRPRGTWTCRYQQKIVRGEHDTQHTRQHTRRTTHDTRHTDGYSLDVGGDGALLPPFVELALVEALLVLVRSRHHNHLPKVCGPPP